MKLLIKNIILAFLFFIYLCSSSWSEIKFKEVVVTGVGQSLEEATNNAFAEAISMVNGKNVQTKTIIKVLSGEPLPKKSSSEGENSNFFAKILIQLTDSSKEKKEEPKKKKDENKNPKKVEYSQNYLKEIIDETKGGIKSYEIIKKKIDKNGWHNVKLKAEVAFFDLPKEAMRVRMAIFPFKLYEIEGDKNRFNRLIDQNINDYFVQTKKFTMLDRTYIEEVAKEQSTILDGKTPAVEMAKIGNEISADFILVGSVENFNITEKIKKILSSDMEIKKKEASIYMSYRLLDVATKQISYSNTIEYKLSLSENSKKPDIEIISKVSKMLGEEILFSIYPVLVEKITNGEIYLGQGGNQFQKSDKYELFEKGEKIIDSYTNEVIGNVETSLGLVEITSVSTGYSKGKMLSKENKLPEDFTIGSYLIRPIKLENSNNEKTFEENKEKIKKKKEEKKKKLDDEF